MAPDNMMAFREDGLVCTVICLCIVLGASVSACCGNAWAS